MKTFEQFDFTFQPSIDERQMRELRTLRLCTRRAVGILLAFAWAVGQSGHSVGELVTLVRTSIAKRENDHEDTSPRAGALGLVDCVGMLSLSSLGANLIDKAKLA